jgi:hypothetical protein
MAQQVAGDGEGSAVVVRPGDRRGNQESAARVE